jgi:hypothetical protein
MKRLLWNEYGYSITFKHAMGYEVVRYLRGRTGYPEFRVLMAKHHIDTVSRETYYEAARLLYERMKSTVDLRYASRFYSITRTDIVIYLKSLDQLVDWITWGLQHGPSGYQWIQQVQVASDNLTAGYVSLRSSVFRGYKYKIFLQWHRFPDLSTADRLQQILNDYDSEIVCSENIKYFRSNPTTVLDSGSICTRSSELEMWLRLNFVGLVDKCYQILYEGK